MKCLIAVYLSFASSMVFAFDPLVSVDVSVVSEDGRPIEGASVRGDFSGVVSGSGGVERELSDESGEAVVTGRSLFPVRVIISKDGYYPSKIDVETTESVNGKTEYKDQVTRLVLREKKNPIPLYAKRYSGELPVSKMWVGFDMENADWVAPYGMGVVSDLLFWYEGEVNNINDGYGDLRVRVNGADDGIQMIERLYHSSHLKVPYEAVIDGYVEKEKKWFKRLGRVNERSMRPNTDNKYFLRLRTVKAKDGKIEQANYAKLYGDIEYSLRSLHGGVSSLEFYYYFNPIPNDRNLEFDPYRNLFRNLPHEEQVREP